MIITISNCYFVGLNVTQLHQIQLIVRDLDINLNYLVLGDDTHPKYTEECLKIANELQKKEYFHQSRLFAEVVQLQDLDITVNQVNMTSKICVEN